MKIVTHDSGFHTDDVFAVATLLLVYPQAEVVRSRDKEIQSQADILVDTGMKYDEQNFLFDHHQPGGAGARENGISYASFGLVWKKYGENLAGGKEEAEMIDRRLVQAIDATDNGIAIAEFKFEGVREYTISDYLFSFIEERSPEKLNSAFQKVVLVAQDVVRSEIKEAKRIIADRSRLESYFAQNQDKRVIILEEDLRGWKDFARGKPQVLFVIHPRPDDHWTLSTIQDEEYQSRKALPKSWGGLDGQDLQTITGVADAIFCHKNLFMAVTKTKEAAIKLAEMALNS